MRNLFTDEYSETGLRLWEGDQPADDALKFATYGELVAHCKSLPGEVQVTDLNCGGIILLENGEVKKAKSQFGDADAYLLRHWKGITLETEEVKHYSVYDVYKPSELL